MATEQIREELREAREGMRGLYGKTVRETRVRSNAFGLPAQAEVEFDDGDILVVHLPYDNGRYLAIERDERAQQ
jgi:hypothetical protein